MSLTAAAAFKDLATTHGAGAALKDEHSRTWWHPHDSAPFHDLVAQGYAIVHRDRIGFDHPDYKKDATITAFGLSHRGERLAAELYPRCTQCDHGMHESTICGFLDVHRVDPIARTIPMCYCGDLNTESMPPCELVGTLQY